MLKDIFPVAIL